MRTKRKRFFERSIQFDVDYYSVFVHLNIAVKEYGNSEILAIFKYRAK